MGWFWRRVLTMWMVVIHLVHHPPAHHQLSATDEIRAGFGRFGPVVAAQAVRVANCESTLNPRARNGGHYGLFQLAAEYHRGRAARLGFTWAEMMEAHPNVMVAVDLYAEQGWAPWSCRWAAR